MSGPGYPYGAPPPQYGGYGAPPYGAAPYAPPGEKPAKPQQPGGYGDPYAAAPYGDKPPKNQQPGGYSDPYAAASPYGEKPPKTQQPGGYSDPYAAAPYGEKPPKTQQPGGYPPSAPPAAGYADPYAAAPYGDKPSKAQYADPYGGGGYDKPSKAQYADPYGGSGGYEKPGKPHQGGGYGDPYGGGSGGGGGYEKPSKMQQGGGYQGGYGGGPYGGSPFAALVPSAFPPGTDPNVVACFQAADHDGSGFIDDKELQGALSSYNQSFSLRTVHLLMYLFTSSNLRKIGPKEFTSVFYSLQSWRGIFDRADRDRSGKIEVPELRDALLSLGFAVSPVVLDLLVSKYDKSGGKNKAIEYDAFIECCLTVKGLTEKFKEKDVGFRGSATFTYEEFMLTVLPFLIA